MSPLAFVRRTAACVAALLLAACSTVRPWVNEPRPNEAPSPAAAQPTATPQRPIIAAVTLSGGGARAAAFGLGVLQELKDTRFELEGSSTTLLDEVGLVSGVSGGSVLATYYAAFGDETLTRFEPEFLLADFQTRLIREVVAPANLYRLSSPWWGRSNTLAERLDSLFRGKTFGEVRRNRPWPHLLVTATDLTTGAPFEFTREQFDLICSDLDSVPLSVAVAASSAVPVLLSPMTLRNYAGTCPVSSQARNALSADGNLSARLLRRIAQSYRSAQERPYIHLVDGGLVDNLGVRGLVDQTLAAGSLGERFAGLPEGSVRRIVLVSVNSERDLGERVDHADSVPTTRQVVDALLFGAGSRYAEETTAMVEDVAQRLREEVLMARGKSGSPFAEDAELFVINVSLRGLRDLELRDRLLNVPTAFEILPLQVRQLQLAGRLALRDSAEFQRLRRSLGLHGETQASTPKSDQTATNR